MQLLTFEAGKGHPPKKRSPLGFHWNTSHRNDTCRQEGHTGVNYSVHTTQPKPSNEATNHSRPRRGTGAESRSSTATRTFNDADLWAPQYGFCILVFFFFCNQSQVRTTTSMREKKKKHKTNEEMRDCRTTKNIKARQDNTKQKAKAKHRLALNISNGITSSKWLQQIKRRFTLTDLYPFILVTKYSNGGRRMNIMGK